MMKWDDIYDRSKDVVRQAMNRIADEESVDLLSEDERDERLIRNLQDSGYLAAEQKRRERYNYREAFWRLKHQERQRRHLRVTMMISGAACIVIACCLLIFQREGGTEIPMALVNSREVIKPGEMKAILMKADGEELMLDSQRLQWSEGNGAVLATDSTGLQYEMPDSVVVDIPEYNTLIVPRGGVYQLTLADGTKVWLNSDSRLVYPVAFTGDKREVKLSGEAYFDVVKDKKMPFVVETDLGEVKVLGTQFNVKCYPEETVVATTLVTGSVCFSNAVVADTKLTPGYQLIYAKDTDKIEVRKVNVLNYVGWKENQFSFQGETLENIMSVLGRWYDVNVVFEDEASKRLEFSGNLDKYTNIDTFFRLFEWGANVQFDIRGKVIYIKQKK